MLKNRKRKAFTIVELVIVIAVIAILAAVLIPTFSNIVNKANVSADTQLVRNLNTALISDNQEHETMYDALQAAEKFGYDVDKINASATDNEILWDSKNDVFCYLNDGAVEYVPNSVAEGDKLKAGNYKLWKISDEVDATYSTYYTGTETVITTSKGFDAGETTGIVSITYTYTNTDPDKVQNVVIRTNGGNLIIDDTSTGSISHYNLANSINIIECHTASYHEFGVVPFIEISEGHLVLESDSIVTGIHIDKEYDEKPSSTNEGGAKKASQFGNVEISIPEGVNVPTFSRDEIESIDSVNGTKVCTLNISNDKQTVILHKEGIYEQAKVSNSDNVTNFVDVSDATVATKRAVSELSNSFMGERNAEGKIATTTKSVDVVLNDQLVTNNVVISFDYETREFTYTVTDSNNQTITNTEVIEQSVSKAMSSTLQENGKDSSVAKDEAAAFESGDGSKNNPWVIMRAKQFANINLYSEKMRQGEYYYFVFGNDIDLRDLDQESEYLISYFNGTIDGKNYKLFSNDNYPVLVEKYLNACAKDMVITLTGIESMKIFDTKGMDYKTKYIEYNNVDYTTTNSGYYYFIGHNSSLYGLALNYNWNGLWDTINYTVVNCDVDINLKNDSGANSGIFFGGYVYDYPDYSGYRLSDGTIIMRDGKITIKDCTYSGRFVGGYVCMAISNGQGNTTNLYISGLKNEGTLLGSNDAHIVAAQNYDHPDFYDQFISCNEGVMRKMTSIGLEVNTENNEIIIGRETTREASTYIVELYGSLLTYNEKFGAVSANDPESYSFNSEINSNYASYYRYSIKFKVSAEDAEEIYTGIKKGVLVDYDTAIRDKNIAYGGLGLTIGNDVEWKPVSEGSDDTFCIVKTEDTIYYVVRMAPTTNGDYFRLKVMNPTIYVSAYDALGNLVGCAEKK